MTIDLSPIVAPVALIAVSAIATALSAIAHAVLKHLPIANAAALSSQIDQALQAGAGEAYRQAVLHEHDLTVPAGQNAAIAIAANYVLSRIPEALDKAGVTPDEVDQLVAARIGRLLAVDPTVTITPPAPAVKGTPAGEQASPAAHAAAAVPAAS